VAINNGFLYYAKVMHKRIDSIINQFVYNVFYICFDISKINEIKNIFLSINRFNIFSFYFKDHANKDNQDINIWIKKILQQEKIDHKVKKIFLFTHPRVFGYVFNPVSFWFCLNENDQLISVLAQVNNTFKENHSYLIKNNDHSLINENQWFETNKQFYVSPFYPVEGVYKFRFIFNQKKIAIWINYYHKEKTLLTSVITSNKKELNSFNLLIAFLKIPFVTSKVIFLIHYQALKLFFKKAQYHSRPKQKTPNLTNTKL